MKYLPVGKLDSVLLERQLARNQVDDARVIVGPAIGEDAAVIDFGNTYLVAKTDPITFTVHKMGWYAVNINANDIAVMGATPKWFLATILLPEGRTDTRLVTQIFRDIIRATKELGVTLCGGHTEITGKFERPVIVGHMLGEVEKDRLVVNTRARPGDDILLAKGVAIEGTAIIALEKAEKLKMAFGERFVKRAQAFLRKPGISVVKDALLANSVAKVHAMHDPTEGGLVTGIQEIMKASGTGAIIYKERILYYKETERVCELYNIDPLGLIASGALLIVTGPKDTEKVIGILNEHNIACSMIGKITDKRRGLKFMKNGMHVETPKFKADEITRVL